MNERDDLARAASDAVDAWCAANPAPSWPVLPEGVTAADFTTVWSGTVEHDPTSRETRAWFTPRTEPIEVTYVSPMRPLASALTQFANLAAESEADREGIAAGWPWGAWWLYVRAGVHFEDRAAVRDRYEAALGWAKARGSLRDMQTLESFTDAVAEVYGGFPEGWPR